MSLRRKRLVAWIATMVVALNAFWPLIAQAAPKISSLLIPVCSTEGKTHYIEIASGKTPFEKRTVTHGEHCKLCVFGSGKGVAVLPSDVFTVPDIAFADQKFVLAPVPFAGPASRSPAHPRAPPSQA